MSLGKIYLDKKIATQRKSLFVWVTDCLSENVTGSLCNKQFIALLVTPSTHISFNTLAFSLHFVDKKVTSSVLLWVVVERESDKERENWSDCACGIIIKSVYVCHCAFLNSIETKVERYVGILYHHYTFATKKLLTLLCTHPTSYLIWMIVISHRRKIVILITILLHWCGKVKGRTSSKAAPETFQIFILICSRQANYIEQQMHSLHTSKTCLRATWQSTKVWGGGDEF